MALKTFNPTSPSRRHLVRFRRAGRAVEKVVRCDAGLAKSFDLVSKGSADVEPHAFELPHEYGGVDSRPTLVVEQSSQGFHRIYGRDGPGREFFERFGETRDSHDGENRGFFFF